MNKKDLRIIFLGNPEFARYQLEKILDHNYNVVAVVSAPDKPAGRGMKVNSTPVTLFAREKDIPCLQPKNLKNPDFIAELKSYNADLQIVIAFRMLPEVVWDMPKMGTYNLHASLLPQYRGAAPINWAIMNGEKTTGVSTFKLKHEIDTGNLLVQKSCSITHADNAGTLHDKLMHLGGEAVIETLDQVISGRINEIPQVTNADLKIAPKLFTENTQMDWNKSSQELYNFVRGLCPYPVAHTIFDGKNLKIYGAEIDLVEHELKPGTFASDNKHYLKVATKDGWLNLMDVKMEGKRRMPIKDFLNGYDISHLNLIVL